MTTLSISDNDALKEYPSASPVIKTILETSFGKAFFSQKITDRVKSFEDACNVLGISTNIIGGTADEIAYRKLKIIIQALNEGWTPNWNDTDEPKYYPWFYQNAPGFRLNSVVCRYITSIVGSRLCFRSRELAEYAVAQFPDLYKTFFTA
jgi:hypothetical protein